MRDTIPILIVLLSFGAVAAVIFIFGQSLAIHANLQRRLSTPNQTTRASGYGEDGALHSFVAKHFSEERFGIDATARGQLRNELLRAGFFGNQAINYYIAARIILAVAAPIVVYLILVYGAAGAPWYLKAMVLCGSIAIAAIAPNIYLDRRQKRLARRYREVFPNFLDLLVVCIDAGMSLEAAFDRVRVQVTPHNREFGLNLTIMGAEMRAGRSTIDALEALTDRLMIGEARSLALVLRQSFELGSDVGDTLRVFSEEMREKRVLLAEEHANKLPVKLSFPLTLCIFPVILIVVLYPAIVRIISTLHVNIIHY